MISIIELIWFYTVKLYRFSKEPPKDKKPELTSGLRKEIEMLKPATKHGYSIKRPKIKLVEQVSVDQRKW